VTQYVIDSNGRKKAVILTIKQFERMKQDLHDMAMVAERRNERTMGVGELKRRLRKDGLV